MLSPLFANHVEPFLKTVPGLEWFFHGPAYGPSILLAGDRAGRHDPAHRRGPEPHRGSRRVALDDREAAMALGATRWQVIREVVFPGRVGDRRRPHAGSRTGLGESIAVAMVIGNSPSVPHSLIVARGHLGLGHSQPVRRGRAGDRYESVIALAAVLLVLTLARQRRWAGAVRGIAGPSGPSRRPATGEAGAASSEVSGRRTRGGQDADPEAGWTAPHGAAAP